MVDLTAMLEPPRRAVLTTSVALGFAVGVFAILFGVGAVAAGASTWQACAMSLLAFTGASQFSAVAVLASGGSVGSALGGALLLAVRNGVFGLTMSKTITGNLATRLVAAQLTLDESTAMASSQDEPDLQRLAFWATGISVYVFWNLGTLIGALAGSAIDPTTYGLDAAIPAAFVAMLWPHLRTGNGRRAAALGAIVCLATTPFLPIGLPILVAATAIFIGVRTPAGETSTGPTGAPDATGVAT